MTDQVLSVDSNQPHINTIGKLISNLRINSESFVEFSNDSFYTKIQSDNIVKNAVITIPNETDTLVGRETTDSLLNKTLVDPIISQIKNGAYTIQFPAKTDTLVGLETTDELKNKTLIEPTMSTINVGGEILTLPAISDTLIGKESVDVLTNKTSRENCT